MATVKAEFIGSAYQSRSISIDNQECVNLYPEIQLGGSKSVIALIGTPGLELFATATNNGKCRGLYSSSIGGRYSVNGNTLYEISEDGIATSRGVLGTVSGSCTFADDGYHLVIADGSFGYELNLTTNVFRSISDDGFIAGSHVVFIDGFFVMNRKNTGQFSHTTARNYPTDDLIWDVLDFFTAENFPDNLVSILKLNNEIWLFGEKSTEAWYNTGDSDNQFMRFRSAVLNIGTAAKYGCAANGKNVFWVGSNTHGQGIVFKNSGYQEQRISTHAIEHMIGEITDLSGAIGFCYQQEGHEFYILHFKDANKSFCYDNTTGLWHIRTSYDSTYNVPKVHRGLYHAMWDGLNYVGDYDNGNIYKMSLDVYSDNGVEIQRIRSTPHIHKDNKLIFFKRFEIDMEKGVGLTGGSTVQGDAPRAILTWSDDGGFTWSNEYLADIGALGAYNTRIQWHRMGTSRDRIFRVMITDPVKVIFIGATMDVEIERG